jgi:hypothetical protein
MEDSFSILGLPRELCEEATEEGSETEVKHFVFEDLLDTHEKLVCYSKEFGKSFSVFSYILKKEKHSFFSKEEERELGCYLGYKDGSLYTFEDFNFKISSLDEFTLLTEAVEVTSGISFFFELCNLCQVHEQMSGEQEVILTLYSQEIKKLPPLSKFDQIADENREVLKLAVKGNEKAVEKLERELGLDEAIRLVNEFKRRPQELFDTCVLSSESSYSLIGIVTSVKEVELQGTKFLAVDLFAEEFEFTALTKGDLKLSEGERLLTNGKMFGIAVT